MKSFEDFVNERESQINENVQNVAKAIMAKHKEIFKFRPRKPVPIVGKLRTNQFSKGITFAIVGSRLLETTMPR